MCESVYIILNLLKAILITYIIVSTCIAIIIFILTSNDIAKIACIYFGINNIDYKKAFSRKNVIRFIEYGFSYAIFYIAASIKLRLVMGREYKTIISTVYALAKACCEGLTMEEAVERLHDNEKE